MINTYQTSLAPPPVPPRHGRSHSVLIPTPLPSQGHSKSLIRFLVGVVLLHLFLSVGGFIYLYYNAKMEKLPSSEQRAAAPLSGKPEPSKKAFASMVVDQQSHSAQKSTSGCVRWDFKHSILQDVSFSHNSWVTVVEPGHYYVYFSVTFSKADPQNPLFSRVNLRNNETGQDKTVMKAFCNLESRRGSGSGPPLCTATQGGMIKLESGNQLSVWVQDLSLVNFEDGATTFGMYKL